MYKVIIPQLGEGIEKALVACWHHKVGERVAKDNELVELVTDKASFSVASEVDGQIKSILVPEGQEAKIGDTLAEIEPGQPV